MGSGRDTQHAHTDYTVDGGELQRGYIMLDMLLHGMSHFLWAAPVDEEDMGSEDEERQR